MMHDEPLGPAGLRVAQLRNALMIVNASGHTLHQVASIAAGDVGPLEVGFRKADLEDLRRLLNDAIVLATTEYLELQQARKNLDRAMADRRRLEAAIVAPKVVSSTRIASPRDGRDVFLVVLTDGSVREFYPNGRTKADRWAELDAVPTTRAAVLATPIEATAAA